MLLTVHKLANKLNML